MMCNLAGIRNIFLYPVLLQIVNTGCVAMFEPSGDSLSNPVDNPVAHVIKVDNLITSHKW